MKLLRFSEFKDFLGALWSEEGEGWRVRESLTVT